MIGGPINPEDVAIIEDLRRRVAVLEMAAGAPPGFGGWLLRQLPEGPVNFRNDSSEAVPAHGVMAVTGATSDRNRPLLICDKPSTTLRVRYAINSEMGVAASGGRGFCYVSGMTECLYETGTPAVNEVWGPKPGEWELFKGFPGVSIISGIADSTAKLLYASIHPVTLLIGKTTGAITAGGTSDYEIYAGTLGSETATTYSPPAAWTRIDLADDIWITIKLGPSGWFIEPLECS